MESEHIAKEMHDKHIESLAGVKQLQQRMNGAVKMHKEKQHAMHRTHEALRHLGAGKEYGEK